MLKIILIIATITLTMVPSLAANQENNQKIKHVTTSQTDWLTEYKEPITFGLSCLALILFFL